MDNEQKQDAQVDPSPTPESQTDANKSESQETDSSTVDTTQSLPSQQQDANKGADPNTGLPPKDNLYGEFRRKIFEEIAPIIQGSVREAMLGVQGQQQTQVQTPELKYQGKYSTNDLEAILRHPDAIESDKLFATRGLAYIEARQDTMKDIDQKQEKQVNQSRQGQALQGIVSDYPQVFNKQTNQWNFADPLWQKTMQIYNNNDRLKSFGNEGLRVAMDSAYAQMAREGQVTLKKKETQLNSKQRAIDKNQSQALTSGTLTPVKDNGATSSKSKIMEAWKKNPDSEDAKKAVLNGLVPKSWFT